MLLAAPIIIRAAEAIGDRGRDRRFRGERSRQMKRLAAIQRDTMGEIRAQLQRAQRIIAAQLANGTPGSMGSYRAFALPNLQRSVRAALREAADENGRIIGSAARSAIGAGVDLVDAPLDAGGVRIAGALQSVDLGQLEAMRTFMTSRMRDVSLAMVDKINGELAQVVIGTRSVGEAIDAIDGMIEGGRGRALAIVRTELGRAYASAAQDRMAQAAEVVPGLKKEWRRSGKVNSRPEHDLADGQVRAVDEPFLVGGVELMYPRDPAAPPSATVNCGCVSLPVVDSWS